MSEVPEGWEFLLNLPAEWLPPAEISHPPRGPMANLLIDIVSSELSGNDIIELAATALSAYARLNAWLGASGNRQLGFEGVTRLSTELSFNLRDTYHAWVAFRDKPSSDRRTGVADRERAALLTALNQTIKNLRELGNPT